VFGAGIRKRFVKANPKPGYAKLAVMLVLTATAFAVLITPAAAANETSYSINWSALGDLISGVGDLMPSIGNLVVAVVPILLLLIVVGFLVGLFDSIIGAIQDAFRMFGRR